uniref:Uncharacterized protein n=1 Tax=Anguilla anguilla TaxID=7936 RepID=A0A0E9RV14_ANGAN
MTQSVSKPIHLTIISPPHRRSNLTPPQCPTSCTPSKRTTLICRFLLIRCQQS